jgi:23S rRNA (guanosine2251-2'-O)-methyltransferase
VARRGEPAADLLYGRNAVYEALRAGRRQVRRLRVAAGAHEGGRLREVVQLAEERRVRYEHVERRVLDREARGANHQGVLLDCGPYPYVALEDALERAAERREPPLLLLLDHLHDPQNVGTLLRTAEAVGVHGVVLPERRAVGITPAVVNASSGASEHLACVQVTNLARTIAEVQQAGLWVAGLDSAETATIFDEADLSGPLALVVGAEGPGLARLTRDRCDLLIRLPMRGQVESLNAAVAGSIALYYSWRQRPPAAER